MANRKINVSALEFDQIKENLKEFLRGQAQFSDYDFEGSNMAVLLDVLAYNTHYNAMYTNMALNELFLDSASKRDSVVSLAKGLGYIPRSASCAKVTVDFKIINTVTEDPFITLPKLTQFNGSIDENRFTFYTTKDITTARNSEGEYVFEDVVLVEGTPLNYRMPYTADNRYLVPNPTIDTSTLVVRVQPDPSSSLFTTYKPATLQASIDGESKVYFIKEIDAGYHEISFGDGILGAMLAEGNVINIEYFVSSGTAANGIKTLYYGGQNINGGVVTGLTMQSQTTGGRFAETIEEIRYNAPNMYAAQNRAVTSTDYESIILNKVPQIDSVIAWGGENNVPPVYGKIFISATTKSGFPLSTEEQRAITTDVIDKFKVVSIIPEFRQPDFLDIELDLVAYFDKTLTSKSPEDIQTTITQLLLEYNNLELNKFNRIYRQSAVSRIVDSADPSIISSSIRTKVSRIINVFYNTKTNYSVYIGNPIEPNSVTSTGYVDLKGNGLFYVYDDGAGVMKHYAVDNNTRVDYGSCGTVDYESGLITINGLTILSLPTQNFRLQARPASQDIASVFNQVVRLDTGLLKVSMIVDNSTQGRTLSGNKFIFTPNKI